MSVASTVIFVEIEASQFDPISNKYQSRAHNATGRQQTPSVGLEAREERRFT